VTHRLEAAKGRVLHVEHSLRFTHLFLTALAVTLFLFPALAHAEADEPQVRIETLPRWQSATLNIYIFGMPSDGAELTQTSIILRVAVWGATEDDPLIIQLDGDVAARITYDGLFTFEWSLRGSHHLLLRDRYKIFDQATFNVKAPPPPPMRIAITEFEEKLKEQFTTMLMAMISATALGVPSGIWMKKRTKITSQWAFVLPAAAMGLGVKYLPSLYMMIPWGIAAALTYQLAKPYATPLTLLSLETNQIDGSQSLYVDDDGMAIIGVGPRYWRHFFILRKNIKFVDAYHVTLNHHGLHRGVCVKKLEETESLITVECDRALAEVIVKKEALEKATTMVQELWTENTTLEALGELKKEQEIRLQVKARVKAVLEGRGRERDV